MGSSKKNWLKKELIKSSSEKRLEVATKRRERDTYKSEGLYTFFASFKKAMNRSSESCKYFLLNKNSAK